MNLMFEYLKKVEAMGDRILFFAFGQVFAILMQIRQQAKGADKDDFG